MRALLKAYVEALLGAVADAACRVPNGRALRSRRTAGNSYRARTWDTRVATIELGVW